MPCGDIRYYLGRHRIMILSHIDKKVVILHLECGYTGNKKLGYKIVRPGAYDIAPLRCCWIHRRQVK